MTIWTPDLEKLDGPKYQAIAVALAADIAAGRLRPGQRLPTHRELARRLGITVGTVSRAYAEAERRGLISGEVGRGSFVRGASRPGEGFGEPAADGLGLVDLSLSVPPMPANAEELAAFDAGLSRLARFLHPTELLGCQPLAGARRHREAGARWIGTMGLPVDPERVLVCAGAQSGIFAILATLLRPGDLLLTETLTYPGVKAMASLLSFETLGLAMDQEGLVPEAIDEAARTTRGRVLFTMPSIHNPAGTVQSAQRRRRIAEAAARHGITIVEDDVHGFLLADREPPLSAFAEGPAFYVTSTSKLMAPGLRIGYIAAPEGMVPRLSSALFATVWMASPAMAELASGWIEDGTAERFAAWRRHDATERGHLARQVLGEQRTHSHPQSFHLWLELPETWRPDDFVAAARREAVAVSGPEAFSVGAAPRAVRVCPSAERDLVRLERALGVLADLLAEAPEPAYGLV
jgi:DNA-binding transcriptional MocR family regulator